MSGLFIVLEGPDGSGKSTQIDLLKNYLEKNGQECLITREPGGTRIGEGIRDMLLNPEFMEMSDETEMLLYAASRAQLIHDVIGPALDAGKVVISDRFVYSSMVYQGIARGLGIDTVEAINAPGIGQYRPDCVFFIDIPEEEGIRRKKQQKQLDRLEQESIDFHHLVSEGYRTVLRGREEVIEIDGCQTVDAIQQMIRDAIGKYL
ncbi:MAG: dTMP kinase [Eubacteriales bacterium]|nr:dTMP kinase [Eubacteriales bacterium]